MRSRADERLTGLSPEYIKRANLRVDLSRFRKELLRDERLTVGRYDTRYTGIDPDAAGENPEYDASDTAITGAFIGALHNYLGATSATRPTCRTGRAPARHGIKWDWKPQGAGRRASRCRQPEHRARSAAAMRENPYLKVLSLNGCYDMATPFFGTEYDLGHMMLDPSQQRNLEFRYYPSGHMVYLNPDALHQMRVDVQKFISEAVGEAERSGAGAARPAGALTYPQ